MASGLTPHNERTRWFNCRGMGTCGTCAVRIEGDVDPPSARERARLNFYPLSPLLNLRLACQVVVQSDLKVQKFDGFWGQHVPKKAVQRPAS
ncbi:MAG: 2Fe-2S iron-sulfur cluster-binding protein [Myxococcota bacterium]